MTSTQEDLLAHIKRRVRQMDIVFEGLEIEYEELKLLWDVLTPNQRQELERDGVSVESDDPQDG